jgi:Domain of unknown function (DUF6950)
MSSLLADLAAHQHVGNTAPFVLGTMDCSLWCADWVQMQTGVDLAAEWRGTYSTEQQYQALLLAKGGLVRVAAQALKLVAARRIEPVNAKPGDIGIIVTTKGPALAIRGQLAWMAKTGDQLSTAPVATFAWRL